MTDKIKTLFIKYKSEISYLFFGGCTTLLNIAAYWVFNTALSIPNTVSTALAWVVSVIFAFVTNKLLVFESRSLTAKVILREAGSFFLCRALTGALDVGIMYLAVDVCAGNNMLWKVISNVIVIILNYFASKLFIFKKRK